MPGAPATNLVAAADQLLAGVDVRAVRERVGPSPGALAGRVVLASWPAATNRQIRGWCSASRRCA